MLGIDSISINEVFYIDKLKKYNIYKEKCCGHTLSIENPKRIGVEIMPPLINQEKCIRCGICVDICPLDVIKKDHDTIVVKYPEECWHCRACVMD